jgi:large subunit ribosomal protein L15
LIKRNIEQVGIMPKRKKKKKVYLRGFRRHGHGNIKNRRGSGNKGGKGNAGLHKHKWTYTVKYLKDHFGKKGFLRHNKKQLPVINLWEIEKLASEGKLDKIDDRYIFEFKGKVLGLGTLTSPVVVKALSFSSKAMERIKEAGGEALLINSNEK